MRALGTRQIALAVVAAAIVVVAVVLLVGGDDDVNNNAENYDGTEAEVATLVDDFANAARDGEGEEICSEFFTDELVENIERESGQSCTSEIAENLPEGEYELEIDTLQVEGDAATVGVTDQDDNNSVLNVTRSDAAWQVASVTAGE